jgi:predicted dehydrogenase
MQEIRSGRLGSLRAVNAVQFGNPKRRLPKWYEQLPLGLFYDESPHLLYLLRLVAGPVTVARSIVFPSSTGLRTPARIDAFFESDAISGPVTLHCNFESAVSEWYLMVFGEHRLGIVDVFRDIYLSIPNDGQHTTKTVLRTTLSTFGQHFWQHLVSGLPHLTGHLRYGNTELFQRFAYAIAGADDALLPINGESALSVLRLQHAIIENQEIASRRLTEVLQ